MMNKINFSNTAIFMVLFPFITGCMGENPEATAEPIEAEESTLINNELAGKLGADDYGMKTYVMAFLKAGPNRSQDADEATELQRQHMATINRLADEGHLVLAGPFLDDGDIRGLYLFDVSTVEEARKLAETDPAIQAGRFTLEFHKWYGSAAILKVNEIHKQIARESP